MLKKYNANREEVGALDLSEVKKLVRKKIMNGGLKWLSKVKRTKGLEDIDIDKIKSQALGLDESLE